jgi:murein DD-endopeptidase MepM/ murein hydrolase activator NlpD
MSQEDPEAADESGHRALPSVDMPLLREQRRASRVKLVTVASAIVAVLVVGLGAAIAHRFLAGDERGGDEQGGGGQGGGEPAAEVSSVQAAPSGVRDGGVDATPSADLARAGDAPLGPRDAGEPVSSRAANRQMARFGQASGFRAALRKAGIDDLEYTELEPALKEVMDFRRCRPEDRMVIEREDDGTLVRFEYHGRPTSFIEAVRQPDGVTAQKVDKPMETVRVARAGRVERSLGDALVRAGFRRSLLRVFLSAFDGRVNFSTDSRKGDRFRVIVDEHHLEGEFYEYGTVHALEYEGQRTGTLQAFWFDEPSGRGDFYDADGKTLHGWLKSPCRYDRISSPFDPHRKHPILGRVVPHLGMDFAAGRGTPVEAAAGGRVTFAGRKGANGNLVGIRHEGGFRSLYAHLQRIEPGIEVGTRVEQGERIGYVGSTGRSTGPHLHFALRRGGRFVDPAKELNGPGRRMRGGLLAPYKRRVRKLQRELRGIDADQAAQGEQEDEVITRSSERDRPADDGVVADSRAAMHSH